MKFNIRGYSTAVSRDSFPQGCVAARVSPPRPLKNKHLLFCESEVSEHLISLFSPVPPLLLLSLLTRIIPVEDFSLPLSHPVPREQLPSSSFRLRTKRNPAPGCFFSLPPFPRYSREKKKRKKEGKKREKHAVGKISREETKRKRRGERSKKKQEEGAVGGRDTRVAQRGRSGVLARCTPFQNHPTNSCNAGGKLALPPLYI